jgi:hypothetical protein
MTSHRGGVPSVEKIARWKKEGHMSDDIKQEAPRTEIISSREPLNVLRIEVSDKIRERECADQRNEQGPEWEQRSLDFPLHSWDFLLPVVPQL